MSSTKINPTRALVVIPSDNCNVPTPYVLSQGTTDASATNYLLDSTADFIVDGGIYIVNTGDVVYNTTTNTAATIVKVIRQQEILLNADIMGSGDNYVIYQEGPTTGLGNQGCILYLGGEQSTDNLRITTIGQDDVTFTAPRVGPFNIQTKKVWQTGTGETIQIIALW